MKKSSLLILGSGGHSKVIGEIAKLSNNFEKICFLDDKYNNQDSTHIIGKLNIENLNKYKYKFDSSFVAIGDNKMRAYWMEILKEYRYLLPNLIHPNAIISSEVILGKEGICIMAGSILEAGTEIKSGAIINSGATINHDCCIDKYVHVSPGCNIAGNVIIEEYTWIGIGTCISNNLSIGRNVTVGAGSIVISNIEKNFKVAGVPAEKIGLNNE